MGGERTLALRSLPELAKPVLAKNAAIAAEHFDLRFAAVEELNFPPLAG